MTLPLWLEHVLAIFRGSHGQIVSELDSAKQRLAAHATYKWKVASAKQAKAERALAAHHAAEKAANHSFRVAAKIGDLLT
jgi:hypothetical protein